MVIDFDKIVEEHIQGFKGGEGRLDTRSYVDDKTRIMYSTLRPGARSGEHIHKGTFEVIYVVSGELTAFCDGAEETVRVGTYIIVLKDTNIGLRIELNTM